MKSDLQAFTIRIPHDLAEMIDNRAKLNRRTRNAEIRVLLENAIDQQVERDLQLMRGSSSR